jgi:hypothetical protein
MSRARASPRIWKPWPGRASAARLGIQLSVHPLEGWCALGGPWNKPEHSMRKSVWTATTASGPGQVRLKLPQPEAVLNFYQDALVLAHPAAEDLARSAKVSVSAGKGAALVDAQPGMNFGRTGKPAAGA